MSRRFAVTRTQVLEVELTKEDLEEQLLAGETFVESCQFVAGASPASAWTTVDFDVEEME